MTDTTHEAPERIKIESECGHANRYNPEDRKTWLHEPDDAPDYFRGEYVLKSHSDDLVQAAVAAALKEAAQAARLSMDGDYLAERILALITPDAQAALDRVVAKQREKDAKVAFDSGCGWQDLRTAALSSSWPEDAAKHLASEHAAFAIAAAIRKGGE